MPSSTTRLLLLLSILLTMANAVIGFTLAVNKPAAEVEEAKGTAETMGGSKHILAMIPPPLEMGRVKRGVMDKAAQEKAILAKMMEFHQHYGQCKKVLTELAAIVEEAANANRAGTMASLWLGFKYYFNGKFEELKKMEGEAKVCDLASDSLNGAIRVRNQAGGSAYDELIMNGMQMMEREMEPILKRMKMLQREMEGQE